MRFVWFWTFWHWSRESFREGSLLLSPLAGLGSHWDEWFHHEATEDARRLIAEAGQTTASQRRFMAWVLRHWAPAADPRGQRLWGRFALGQLAHLPPFDQWSALARYREGYGLGGVAAVVLAEQSTGAANDVRAMEAILLPGAGESGGPAVVAEGFHADSADLKLPHAATLSLLSGRGLLVLLAGWIAAGRRPYSRLVRTGLGLGWLGVGALIVHLLTGTDLEPQLPPLSLALLTLWTVLVGLGCGMLARTCLSAWRTGRDWTAALARSQVRLRMEGGLTLQGASAGLAFCLNTLLAVGRAYPEAAERSWLWRRLLGALQREAKSAAATGVVTPDGRIRPVVLVPKLRACLAHQRVEHLLTPRQHDARRRIIDRLATALIAKPPATTGPAPAAPAPSPAAGASFTRLPALGAGSRLGFAAEAPRLRSHPCGHVAQALLTIARFTSRRQVAYNLYVAVVSVVMVFALPDLRALVLRPPPPELVPPGSPSPYHLWVSLETRAADYFQVVLESDYWVNRRAPVSTPDGGGPPRAEILLSRLARQITFDEEQGTVWVERRQRFLFREFAPGERVGRYSLSYFATLAHE